jgi:hypothetical protein
VELPAAERAAFLDRECRKDLELRQRIEALLQAHDQPGSFLNQPAQDLGATSAGQSHLNGRPFCPEALL